MRIAEEIILQKKCEGEKHGGVPLYNLFDVIDAINEARKEVIEECSSIVHDQLILSHPEFIEPSFKKLIKELK